MSLHGSPRPPGSAEPASLYSRDSSQSPDTTMPTTEPEPIEVSARHPELVKVLRARSLQFGDFQLASGAHSSYYMDVRRSSLAPDGAAAIVDALVSELDGLEYDAVGGMDMGATPIAGALALRFHQLGRDVPTFVARKQVKKHGTQKEIEGPLPEGHCRVIIIDDVVTSGGSILDAIAAVKRRGCTVVKAFAVVDRDAGGRERIEAEGIDYQPLVTLTELGIE